LACQAMTDVAGALEVDENNVLLVSYNRCVIMYV
jgi:hypothetical protein